MRLTPIPPRRDGPALAYTCVTNVQIPTQPTAIIARVLLSGQGPYVRYVTVSCVLQTSTNYLCSILRGHHFYPHSNATLSRAADNGTHQLSRQQERAWAPCSVAERTCVFGLRAQSTCSVAERTSVFGLQSTCVFGRRAHLHVRSPRAPPCSVVESTRMFGRRDHIRARSSRARACSVVKSIRVFGH